MKSHVHKLPAFRHPVTRARAVLYPIHGTRSSWGVLQFAYRKRYAMADAPHASRADALAHAQSLGYTLEIAA